MLGNGYKILAIAFAVVMLVSSLSTTATVSACSGEDEGGQADVFKDANKIFHKVWREKVNGVYQIFYSNTNQRSALQLTHSDVDKTYPQVALNNGSGMAYVVWFVGERDLQINYLGSLDYMNWSDERASETISWNRGNPNFDLRVEGYILQIIWKHDNQRLIEPDIDGDYIVDRVDSNIFGYDAPTCMIAPDVVTVNEELGASVAMDWEDNLSIKPSITQADPIQGLQGALTLYINITAESNDNNFTAVIKIKYSHENMPSYIDERYLRIYTYDGGWDVISNLMGSAGGVDIENDYVWAVTSHFSLFTIADSSKIDLNNNAIPDSWDSVTITGNGATEPQRLTIFSGDSLSPKIYISPNDVYHLAWIDNRDGASAVYYKNSIDFGATWCTDTVISNLYLSVSAISFAGWKDKLAIAFSAVRKVGPGLLMNELNLYVSEDAGATWEYIPVPYNAGLSPSVTLYNSDVYLVYEKIIQTGEVPHVYLEGLRFVWSADDVVESDTVVYTETHAQRLVPKVSVDNGVIQIIWAGYFDGAPNKLYYKWKDVSGTSWSDDTVFSENYFGQNDASALDMQVKGDKLYCAWADNRVGQYEIYYKVLTLSTGDKTQDIRLTSTTANSHSPDILIDDNGDAQITWQEGDFPNIEIYYAKFTTNLITAIDVATGELASPPSDGTVTGDYTRVQQANEGTNAYQDITEVESLNTMYVTSEKTNNGHNNNPNDLGRLTFDDDIYERLELRYTNSAYRLEHIWTINLANDRQEEIIFKAKSGSGSHTIEWRGLGGSWQYLGSIVSTTTEANLTSRGIPPYSSIDIRVTSTSGGSGRYILVDMIRVTTRNGDRLDHKWTISVSQPTAIYHTFNIKAYLPQDTATQYLEDVLVYYSLDGSTWINMLTISKQVDDGLYQTYSLPSTLPSTIFVRVVDAVFDQYDWGLTRLCVDHIFIQSENGVTTSITNPTMISTNDGFASMMPSIAMDSTGYYHVYWQEASYGNLDIQSKTNNPISNSQLIPAIQMIMSSSPDAFTTDSILTSQSTTPLVDLAVNTLTSKIIIVDAMLAVRDRVAAEEKLENDLIPAIESIIVDIDLANTIIAQIHQAADPIINVAFPAPSDPTTLSVVATGHSGELRSLWTASPGTPIPTGYEVYRSIANLNTYALWDNEFLRAVVGHVTSAPWSITNTGLQDEFMYYYAVRAYVYYSIPAINVYSNYVFTPAQNHDKPSGPPHVHSSNPSQGYQGFPVSGDLTVVFNEDIDVASITTSTVWLYRESNGNTIAGTRTLSGRTLTFNPDSDLVCENWYRLYLGRYIAPKNNNPTSTTDDYFDGNNNNIGGESADTTYISFKTEPNRFPCVNYEKSSPKGLILSSTYPLIVKIPFLRYGVPVPMKHTLTQAAIHVKEVGGTELTSPSISWNGDSTEITLTYSSTLTEGMLYEVRVVYTAESDEGANSAKLNGDGDETPGEAADDCYWYFRTELPSPTLSITATTSNFYVSWLWNSASTPQNYELYYVFDNPGHPWSYVSIANGAARSYIVPIGGMSPHTTMFFKLFARNSQGCTAWTDQKSVENRNSKYSLDVGAPGDMPYQTMREYGLTLPTELRTDLSGGWGERIDNTPAYTPANWRGHSLTSTNQMFFLNLDWGHETQIDFLLTINYLASGSPDLEMWGQDFKDNIKWIKIGQFAGQTGIWKSKSFLVDHRLFLDYTTTHNSLNLLFRIQYSQSIYIDCIKAEPAVYTWDLQGIGTDNFDCNGPGVSFYPGEWTETSTTKVGVPGARFYINIPDPYVNYALGIYYQSTSSNQITACAMGTDIGPTIGGDPGIHPYLWVIEPNIFFDATMDDNHVGFNVMFKFSQAVTIYSIRFGSDGNYGGNDGLPDLWELGVFGDYAQTSDTDKDLDTVSDGIEYVTGLPPNDRLNIDYDSDGMSNAYETTYGLNPYINDALADADGELNNLLEYQLGTSPIMLDSDGDTFSDKFEYENPSYNLNPSVYDSRWLIMLYMCADDPTGNYMMEEAAINDFNELEKVGSTQAQEIVLQLDLIEGGFTIPPDADGTVNDWGTTRRYYIQKDEVTPEDGKIRSLLVEDLGEINLATSQSIVNFVDWAKQYKPVTNHYCLIFYGHGYGFYSFQDHTSSDDILTLPEIGTALEIVTGTGHLNKKIDVVAFDSCLMASMENLKQLSAYTEYLVGSTEYIPNYGFPYDSIFGGHTDGDYTARDLVDIITQRYINFYNQPTNPSVDYQKATISAIDCSSENVEGVINAIVSLSDYLIANIATFRTIIANARSSCECYGGDMPGTYYSNSWIDLYDLAEKMEMLTSDLSLKNHILTLKNELNKCIYRNKFLTEHPYCHGINIYFPPTKEIWTTGLKTLYVQTSFGSLYNWDEFLDAYYG
jgi:hypothetical protein